ncbi:MAG: glycerophosphodiester phosphodiesterase [Oscillospiraceae bacterium]|jgi:glycerophosphoryl diester phosphodiesterase|nr:glycerophosphodiester phosphodiesterase [Oscillospiraceae bacterium]
MTGFFGECAARPLIAGHRGYRARYPENTMLGYRKALELGVDMLEIDLRLSRDGQLVLIHDGTLDRTTNGTGRVESHALEELRALDAGRGERIPAFEEFLAWAQPAGLFLNVEIKTKTRQAVDKAVALLERYHMLERSVIACFDAGITEYANRQYGARTQGFPRHCMQNFKGDSYDFLYSVGIQMRDLTPALAGEFSGRGIQPWCWCPDTPKEIERMRMCGATLCTCNDPVPALALLR